MSDSFVTSLKILFQLALLCGMTPINIMKSKGFLYLKYESLGTDTIFKNGARDSFVDKFRSRLDGNEAMSSRFAEKKKIFALSQNGVQKTFPIFL